MKPLSWMLGPCLGVWLIAAVSARLKPETFWGMVGPLVASMASWIAYERAHTAAPERLTNVLLGAFAAKLVFFVGYVGMSLGVLELKSAPFAASFVGSFIGLYVIEGWFLRRLVMHGVDASGHGRVLGWPRPPGS